MANVMAAITSILFIKASPLSSFQVVLRAPRSRRSSCSHARALHVARRARDRLASRPSLATLVPPAPRGTRAGIDDASSRAGDDPSSSSWPDAA
jgi:hypothetical protein